MKLIDLIDSDDSRGDHKTRSGLSTELVSEDDVETMDLPNEEKINIDVSLCFGQSALCKLNLK